MGQIWINLSELKRFDASMHRCLADDAFMAKFYDRFLYSSPEVRAKFEGTDITRQSKMLDQSLRLVLKAAGGLEEGRKHLGEIAERHSRRGLGIGPELYQYWLDSLVQVASEVDPEWEESLEATWRAALQPCIDKMISKA